MTTRPAPPLRSPLLDRTGLVSRDWLIFFQGLGAAADGGSGGGGSVVGSSDLSPVAIPAEVETVQIVECDNAIW